MLVQGSGCYTQMCSYEFTCGGWDNPALGRLAPHIQKRVSSFVVSTWVHLVVVMGALLASWSHCQIFFLLLSPLKFLPRLLC